MAEDAIARTSRVRDRLLRRGRTRSPLELLASRAQDITACGLSASGLAAVCCRPVSGPTFAAALERLEVSARSQARLVHWEWDVHGQQWALLAGNSLRRLAAAAASVERTLERRGFGGQLMWSVFGLHDERHEAVLLVYDHRTHRFSPFAPGEDHTREREAEQSAAAVLECLPLEPEADLWATAWDSPLVAG